MAHPSLLLLRQREAFWRRVERQDRLGPLIGRRPLFLAGASQQGAVQNPPPGRPTGGAPPGRSGDQPVRILAARHNHAPHPTLHAPDSSD